MRFGSRFSVFGSQFWVLVTGYELRVTKWLKASGCNHFCPYETATSLLLLRRVSQGKLFTFVFYSNDAKRMTGNLKHRTINKQPETKHEKTFQNRTDQNP